METDKKTKDIRRNPESMQLYEKVNRDLRRLKRARREEGNLITYTVYLGTLGLVFILPVVIGAYWGHWLDEKLTNFSVSWTLSMLFLGLIIGAFNIYFLLRQ